MLFVLLLYGVSECDRNRGGGLERKNLLQEALCTTGRAGLPSDTEMSEDESIEAGNSQA
jgi:hypothetical protein